MQAGRKFRIIETLGRGGFGTVYRARMTDAGGFSKQVALKVLHYDGEAAADMARRMRDEARMLGLLRHRAIVGVTGLVPLDRGWGVVMEYVEGVDLGRALKQGPLPLAVAVEVIEEVASALDAAWNTRPEPGAPPLRLVHRDVKPANIRITAQGEVKLLDFGVARAEFAAREAAENRDFVMGSTRYMAPERRVGEESHKSDVYALGVVFANLTTARRFKEPPTEPDLHARWARTLIETVQRAVTEQGGLAQDPEALRAFSDVRMLLLEMLAFEPDDRPDGATVARRMRRFRTQLPTPWLRDWAETAVPRLLERQAAEDAADGDTGKVFFETSSLAPRPGPPDPPPPPAPTAPPPEPRAFTVPPDPGRHRLLVTAAVVLTVLAALAALLLR